jgi:hypothetical protein
MNPSNPKPGRGIFTAVVVVGRWQIGNSRDWHSHITSLTKFQPKFSFDVQAHADHTPQRGIQKVPEKPINSPVPVPQFTSMYGDRLLMLSFENDVERKALSAKTTSRSLDKGTRRYEVLALVFSFLVVVCTTRRCAFKLRRFMQFPL